MSVGAAGAVHGQAGMILQVLQAAQQMQTEMMEKLIAVDAQQAVDARQMEMIGRLVDVYA